MILKNLEGKKIILASQSPRRQELLKGIGIDFEVIVKKNIDESFDPKMPFEEVAAFLSRKKAAAYKDLLSDNCLIITADTIVCTANEILNKPANAKEASAMLQKLSGKKHKVITGVCIKSLEKELSFSSESIVHFAALTIDEINYYITNYQPFDKAGAYGIQEWIGYIGITRLEGSYFNVMGLPIQLVYSKLKYF
ncbi:MAG: Maf family nucleotide pyrophosphatase [Bacteroidales bacterium]|nr:Maf family nucleotide pyrophosphatase [Bacteroidales bacterium]